MATNQMIERLETMAKEWDAKAKGESLAESSHCEGRAAGIRQAIAELKKEVDLCCPDCGAGLELVDGQLKFLSHAT